MADTTTFDPDVVIEEDVIDPLVTDPVSGTLGARITTYRSLSSGRRWEVTGNCDRRGDCLIGAVLDGDIKIETKTDLDRADVKAIETKRTYDTPVTPEFALDGCCPFTYVELPPLTV